MRGLEWLLVVGLAACSEYDVASRTDPEPDDEEEEEDPEEEPEQEESNLGTKFLAVTTSNPLLPATFANDFAIVVTNPDEDVDANVVVRLGNDIVAEIVLEPDEAETIILPMIPELQLAYTESVKKRKGAYEIESDIPIAAYQFNPLHYQSESFEYSYTNDASMLLPEHVLSGEYMVGAYATWSMGYYGGGYPGFAAVVATEDGTEVTIRSRTQTMAGEIPALSPGQEGTLTLDRGDVFQLLSAGTGGDLTGTTIEASAPIAVFGGHTCTNMPLSAPSCDHLEEMMQPVETWGKEFVMTPPAHPDSGAAAESIYRVVALKDGTTVSFDPAVNSPVTLDEGQLVEFQTASSFKVDSSDKVAVYQYMVGCSALGTSYGSADGDPSMGSGIPMRQARASYVFLVPETYEQNWVNVVARMGSSIELDGEIVEPGDEIGSSGYWTERLRVDAGSHRLASTDESNITVTVYGYADYTSYLYPGGMNFAQE